GWPAWAGTSAGALFFLAHGRLAGPDDAGAIYGLGVATYLAAAAVILVGRRIERTLELLNWVMVVIVLGGSLALALMLVAPATWLAVATGFVGFDPRAGRFEFLPSGADFFLLGAFAAYSGAGGVGNITLSNW